jgi:hypothetical protein
VRLKLLIGIADWDNHDNDNKSDDIKNVPHRSLDGIDDCDDNNDKVPELECTHFSKRTSWWPRLVTRCFRFSKWRNLRRHSIDVGQNPSVPLCCYYLRKSIQETEYGHARFRSLTIAALYIMWFEMFAYKVQPDYEFAWPSSKPRQ